MTAGGHAVYCGDSNIYILFFVFLLGGVSSLDSSSLECSVLGILRGDL